MTRRQAIWLLLGAVSWRPNLVSNGQRLVPAPRDIMALNGKVFLAFHSTVDRLHVYDVVSP